MAKKVSELRARMPIEAQQRSARKAEAMLAAMTCVAVVVLMIHAVAGRTPRYGWLEAGAWGMIVVLVVALADWAWRLAS